MKIDDGDKAARLSASLVHVKSRNKREAYDNLVSKQQTQTQRMAYIPVYVISLRHF